MIDVVLLELSVVLYDFLPNEEHFALIPVIISCLLSILHNIKQTAFIVLKYHY